jgi:DNA-directed RNA polymerase subunit RPC12/RpoP
MEEEQVRCLNCFERIKVPPKTERLTCPKCGQKYVITWRGPQAKIAGRAKD